VIQPVVHIKCIRETRYLHCNCTYFHQRTSELGGTFREVSHSKTLPLQFPLILLVWQIQDQQFWLRIKFEKNPLYTEIRHNHLENMKAGQIVENEEEYFLILGLDGEWS
jgi:hypothetical protein